MEERLADELRAHADSDREFVERAFRLVVRRGPEPAALERALAVLADGTLSRAAFMLELTSSAEFARIRLLDDAVAIGLAARRRGERITSHFAPPRTDERVVEIPWVLSRLRPSGRVLEIGYAYAEPAYLAALIRSGVELVGVDLATRDVEGMETVVADVRKLPFEDGSVDQALLVSTLEHVGSDNSVYGLPVERDGRARVRALRELRRVLSPDGRLLVTVPLGEPGDYGWFRQEDEEGWMRLFEKGWLEVEESETYELTRDGWCPSPAFEAEGVRYGQRGPAASAVLCAELRPGPRRSLVPWPRGPRDAAARDEPAGPASL